MTTRRAPGEAAPRGATAIATLTNGSPWTRRLPSKLPGVSLLFWVLTSVSTAVGATAAAGVSARLGPRLGMSATVAIASLAVGAGLIHQLSTGRCVPGSYWLTVVLVSMLATLFSHLQVRDLGVDQWALMSCAALAAALTCWHLAAHTVSVDAVLTRQREAWYWLVVLCSFLVGTSVGDLVTERLAPGFLATGLVLGGVLGVIAVGHHSLRLNAAMAFWAAYVVTQPLGAALGGLLTAAAWVRGPAPWTRATDAVLLPGLLVVGGILSAWRHRSARKQSGADHVISPTVEP